MYKSLDGFCSGSLRMVVPFDLYTTANKFGTVTEPSREKACFYRWPCSASGRYNFRNGMERRNALWLASWWNRSSV